jgi:hypothetical protein
MGPDLQESSPQSAGYLYDVLADGARSFPFRGGVCSLLGISDRGNGLIKLSPTFHPSGFMHQQNARKRCENSDLERQGKTAR